MSARTPRATPMPMPAFAPALRPVDGLLVAGAGAGAGAAVGVADADEGEVVDVDEDVVAVGSEVDHVVAERSDL